MKAIILRFHFGLSFMFLSILLLKLLEWKPSYTASISKLRSWSSRSPHIFITNIIWQFWLHSNPSKIGSKVWEQRGFRIFRKRSTDSRRIRQFEIDRHLALTCLAELKTADFQHRLVYPDKYSTFQLVGLCKRQLQGKSLIEQPK